MIRATNGVEALNLVRNNDFDLIVTDLTMPKMSGGEFVENLNKEFPKLDIIVITGQTMIDDLSLFNGNVLHFLSKPFSQEDLYSAVSGSREEK